MADADTVDRLLTEVRDGSYEASARLFELLYEELRRVAGRVFRTQRPDHTLSPTVLVHEAYVKLLGARKGARPEDRAHFLNLAARAMRQVLVNHERDRAAQKRGGGRARRRLTISNEPAAELRPEVDLLDLHEALEDLQRLDERQARVAEMRIFGGLTLDEVAPLVGVAKRTAELDWRMAKDHLQRHLGSRVAPGA